MTAAPETAVMPRLPAAGRPAGDLYQLTTGGWVGPAGPTILAQVLASDLHDTDDDDAATAIRDRRIAEHRAMYETVAAEANADREHPELADRLLDELVDIGARLDATAAGEAAGGLERQSVVNYLNDGRFVLPIEYGSTSGGRAAQWTRMQIARYVALRPSALAEQDRRASGVIGVTWSAAAERWRAGVREPSTRPVFLGLFVDVDEAAAAVSRYLLESDTP